MRGMPPLKPIKIALIGYGSIGKTYGEILLDLPRVSLTAIVDPKSEEWEGMINKVPCYATLEKMLANPDLPDAAIICTPPNTHAAIAEACLRAGIDCLIEKPLSLTLEEGKKVVAFAHKLKRKIAESAKYQNLEPLLEIRKRVLQGEIGTLQKVECTFTSPLNIQKNWRSSPSISGGGVWMDNGPHAIAVIESIAGKIHKIRIQKSERIQKTSVEDEVQAETEHENRVGSNIHLSWNRHIPAPYVVATGSKGMLIGDWKETLLVANGSKEVIAGGYDKRRAFTQVIEDFLSGAVENGHELNTLKCILAGYKSVKSGNWEPVE